MSAQQSDRGEEGADYKAAKDRLIARVRPVFEQGSQRTKDYQARRKELRAVAGELEKLADRVELGPAWADLEEAYTQASSELPGLKGVAWSMRALAEAARGAADGVGDPRAQPLLPWCAQVFLHLQHRHGRSLPKNYTLDPVVGEFADLLTCAAGEERGVDRALALLKEAGKTFDPWMPPEGFDEIA